MKLLWAHDHKFFYYDEKYYSKVQFSSDFWERYLDVFEEINVISRLYKFENEDIDNLNYFNISSKKNVNFHSLNYSNNALNFIKDHKFLKKVKCLVSQNDKIIVRMPSTIGLIVGREALKQKKALAVELVGDPWEAYTSLNSFKGNIYAPIIYMYTKLIVKNAIQVLYVTERKLQNRYPNKGVNNVNASNVNIEVTIGREIRKEFTEKENYKIGLIGFLSEYKGIDIAIKALHNLNKSKTHKYFLSILGTGDKEKYYRLAEKFEVIDYIEIKTLPAGDPVINWLDTLDIYIQPSKTEGLPRGLIEAMSRALPAIGTNAGGIPELIEDKYIISKGDFKKLSYLIEKILSNKKIYNTTSAKNFEKAKEYDYSILNNKRYEFYKKLKEGDINE
ncbi:glycosyltransferase [Staphylococcus equorum]|uniref:glycosyltransferase n=1 Tax=Staphylococcus equorum TaxID=246432 RepID=UPI0024086FE1|nr:glycosyltransferase [Staphylococcus equorum]MDG0826068.1 glycosyltransferase [Staphylococcus equorum]MDK9850293.1 glycosyltransferase [Staphylococcus equorum]